MIALEINNVITKYGNATILEDVNMEIEEGSITALLGSNGAGKTTLMKNILGVVKPVAGSIKMYGDDITDLPPHQINKMGITSSPEGRKIFPKMSVEQNLRMGRFSKDDEEEVIQEKIREIYDIFPRLEERANQLGGTLSGGEQGMLAFGRALIGDPKVMLLDEPSLGIQPNIVKQLFEIIEEINKERQITILLAEQNAKQSLKVADFVYLLQKGKVIEKGTAKKMQESDFVQRAYLREE